MGKDKHEKRRKNRLPPFVPLLTSTLDCPAWRAMSHGARSLYVALKRRVPNGENEAYLSHRIASQELGSKREYIARWYRELAHYGFTVLAKPGCLGIEGRGRSPTWRLTELGISKGDGKARVFEEPTRDFANWDGTPFREQSKKQNPGPQKGARVVPKKGPPPVPKKGPLNTQSGPQMGAIQQPQGGPQMGAITSIPLPTHEQRAGPPRPGARDAETSEQKRARREAAAKRSGNARLNWRNTGIAPKRHVSLMDEKEHQP